MLTSEPSSPPIGGIEAEGWLQAVNSKLDQLAAAAGPSLASVLATVHSSGGKRIRPILVRASTTGMADSDPRLIKAAVAVELIHAATLVHDDVLDRAPTRRGRPTIYASAGSELATAAGDHLLATAFAELVEVGANEAITILAAACNAMAEGELMQRADSWQLITESRYRRRCELKTGSLFAASCEIGATLSGDDRLALRTYGNQLGYAFQILDDVGDVVNGYQTAGKVTSTDILDGTVTLPYIYAAEIDTELQTINIKAITTHAEAELICRRIEATGALERARRDAADIASEALAVIKGTNCETTLAPFATALIERCIGPTD